MTTLGTALTPNAIKVMMLGSGELGKEVVIELQRLGVKSLPSIVMKTPQHNKWHIVLIRFPC